MRNHPKALEREGITPARYAELRAICRQYPDNVRYLSKVRAGLEDRPARRGRPSAWKQPDPTGNAAAYNADRAAWEASRVQLVEGCAHAVAGPAIAPALIECVTLERSYEALRHRPPCGWKYFYKLRLLFFVLLDARAR